MNKDYRPMLATLIDAPFNDKNWIFETKWDGFRMIAVIKKNKVVLYSRNGNILSGRYKIIADALKSIGHSAVLDGELVALDHQGVSRFQLLQNALRTRTHLRYYLFDIMFLDGKDVRRLPLIERKALLKAIVPSSTLIGYSEHRWQRGAAYFKEAQTAKEEGIMAKRSASLYHSGKRTREWLKIKTGSRQEVVLVGYTSPRRSRKYFGSLVLAVRSNRSWEYVGHVGTGFTYGALRDLYKKMQPLKSDRSPFTEPVKLEQETTWLTPKLVGEVKFTEWTRSGELRHLAFIGLREDKKATEVVREQPK